MHTGLPLFYRVTVERFGIDMAAVQRQALDCHAIVGSAMLALTMGPDEDMAKPVSETIKLTVCEACSTSINHCVAHLAELGPLKGKS
jgi:hypothetical protein